MPMQYCRTSTPRFTVNRNILTLSRQKNAPTIRFVITLKVGDVEDSFPSTQKTPLMASKCLSIHFTNHNFNLKAMVATLQAPGDREYLLVTLECSSYFTEQECHSKGTSTSSPSRMKYFVDACLWNSENGDCDVRGAWIAELLAGPGKDGDDPICVLSQAYADSGCLDLADIGGATRCESDPMCMLGVDGGKSHPSFGI